MALNRSVNATPAGVIPAAKYPLINQAVLAACDAKDGVADGVLENPGACAFDPKVLQCSAYEDVDVPHGRAGRVCDADVRGREAPDTKALVLPGLAPGAELGWNVLGSTQPLSLAVDAFKYVFMKDRDVGCVAVQRRRRHRSGAGARIRTMRSDSTNADLRPFFARGGKLLMYHGWSDPQVTPYNTINFFHKVLATQGGAGVGTSMQLYMVPGMNHCAGRARHRRVRQGGRARRVDQDWFGAELGSRPHTDQRRRRPYAPAVSARAGRKMERHRQHRRRRQLRVRRLDSQQRDRVGSRASGYRRRSSGVG